MAHRDFGASAPLTTTNTYAQVGDLLDGRGIQELTVVVENTGGTNAADFILEGAVTDDGDFFQVDAVAGVAHGSAGTLQLPDAEYWRRYRVSAKSSASGAATSVRIAGGAGLDFD